MLRLVPLILGVVYAGSAAAAASLQEDKEMNDLARTSGCYLCHAVEPRKPGAQELLPYGPAWRDIANNYKGRADAVDRLTRAVIQGSNSDPSQRHWSGKASGTAMVPNRVEISEADAQRLVRWILSFSAPAGTK